MLQDRYDTPLNTKKLPDGKVVYRSLRPKTIIPNPITDVQITATEGTRMDILANNVYGSSTDWWLIASANGRFKGSLYFKPGSSIIIPKK